LNIRILTAGVRCASVTVVGPGLKTRPYGIIQAYGIILW
jgi:hypothetical protein